MRRLLFNSMNFRFMFFAALIVIGVMSLLPQDALPTTNLSDKLEHLLAYATLCVLGMLAYTKPSARRFLIIGLVLYGGALEGGQSFVPGRFPSILDLVANAVGVGIGYAGFVVLMMLAAEGKRWLGAR